MCVCVCVCVCVLRGVERREREMKKVEFSCGEGEWLFAGEEERKKEKKKKVDD